MSQRPSATAIGGFVLGAIVLVVGSIVFFGGELLGDKEDVRRAVVVFTGSVKGLNEGAPVTLRGVKVGEVRKIGIDFDRSKGTFAIPVEIELHVGDLGVEPDDYRGDDLQPLIVRGLRAQLRTESLLTGLLYIDLGFLPESEPRWIAHASKLPQIPTAPTEIEEILARVSSIDVQAFVQRADNTLRALEALLSDPEMKQLPANLNATISEVRELVSDTDAQIIALRQRLDGLVTTADGTLDQARTEIAALAQRLDQTLDVLDQTLVSLRGTSEQVGYTLSAESPAVQQIGVAAKDISRAARSLRELSDSLERQPESLLRGRRAREEETQ